ncbi:MAG: O-antigen ligase family protein, partial [Clostridia bacterium]|nr:O-antigen ligase family protein [Clostridia bacterium]
MVSSNFYYDSRVRALTKFNENYAFVMLVIFSLMPFLALFSPQSFGPLFTGIAQLEIWSLLILGAFQLISYASFSSRSYSASVRIKLCFLKAWDSLKNNKAALLFLGFYVLSIISAFFAKDPERAYLGTEFRPDGIRMYTAFAAIFVYASLVKSSVLKNRIILINIICFVPVSLVVVQQYFGIIGTAGVKDAGKIGEFLMGIYNNWGIRTGHFYKGMTGSFYNLNHVGYYIVVCSMLISGKFFFAKTLKAKILWGVFALYSYYVMIVNDTFGGYLAILMALIIMPIFVLIKTKGKNKDCILRAFLPLIIFIALNLVFVACDPSGNPISKNFKVLGGDVEKIATSDNLEEEHAGSGRLEMWLATVDMIKERPILGYGPDNLKPHYVERDAKLDRAHNEPIERAVATGIPSAIFYYAAIG